MTKKTIIINKNILDLDVYIENAKLKRDYRLLWEEHRKLKYQLNACIKSINVLKQEGKELYEIFNRILMKRKAINNEKK